MNGVGNPFRFSFIIRLVFGVRLETDDLLVSNADHGHAPGPYQSDVIKDIGGASLVESFDARSDVFDYYDHAEGTQTFNEWVNTPFNVNQTFTFNGCESSSLASMAADVNSSSESLLHGLDDSDQNTATITAHVGARSTNARIRVNRTSRRRLAYYGYTLESIGSTTLNFSVQFTATNTQSYEKTWVYPAFHAGGLAVYINVGLKFTLTLTGSITLTALVPLEWNICVESGGSCHRNTNSVTAHSPTFVKAGAMSVSGLAEVSTSVSFEAANILTAGAQVLSSMLLTSTLTSTGHTYTCHLHSSYAIRLSALTTVSFLANMVGSGFSWLTGSCFAGFGDIELALLMTGVLIDQACPR